MILIDQQMIFKILWRRATNIFEPVEVDTEPMRVTNLSDEEVTLADGTTKYKVEQQQQYYDHNLHLTKICLMKENCIE